MTQSTLKRLAILFMFCDHFAKVVLSAGILRPVLGAAGNEQLMILLESVGRIAFPIFAWFVAEGCRKTHNFPRYLGRMAIFAVLSEAPFQYCFYAAGENGLRLGCHNVMFTLLLAAAGIYASKLLENYEIPRMPAVLLPSILAVTLGWVLQTDYNAWGVALILMLYYLPEKKQRLILLACWMTVFMLLWTAGTAKPSSGSGQTARVCAGCGWAAWLRCRCWPVIRGSAAEAINGCFMPFIPCILRCSTAFAA
jgi:hypothetical protein